MKLDVVHIYKYHFCTWPFSTDNCQVLHAMRLRDKGQMLVLNEKATMPEPPCLVWRTRSPVMRTHLPPEGITTNSAQMWPHAPRVPITVVGVSFSWKKVVCSPSPPLLHKEPRKGHSCGRPRTGHPCNFSTTLNFPLNPTVGDGLKRKQPWYVH